MAACDQTDRTLEAFGIDWSKQSAPAFIGDLAFRYNAVKDLFAVSSSKAWSKDKNDKNLSEQESRSSYCSLRGVKKA